jgi:hypothetical protein
MSLGLKPFARRILIASSLVNRLPRPPGTSSPFLMRGNMGGGFGCAGLAAGDGMFCLGDVRLVLFDRGLVHVLKACPKSFVGFGVLKLQGALLIRRHHWNPAVNVAANLALRSPDRPGSTASPCVKHGLGEAFVHPLQEGNPVGDGQWRVDRAEAGDMLMAHIAADAAGSTMLT